MLLDNHICHYIQESLKECHDKRVYIYYYVLNIGILSVFVLFGGIYLYFAFTKKQTKEEIYQRNVQDKEHVLNQIQRYKNEQTKLDNLTQLPLLERKRGEEEIQLRQVLYN